MIGRATRPYRLLLGAAGAGLLALAGTPGQARFVAAFAVAASVYLALAFRLMARSNEQDVRRRAQEMDISGVSIVLLASLASIASLAAVVMLLGGVAKETGWSRLGHVALVAWAVAAAWAMAHTAFAFHYAHLYYDDAPEGGLSFPGETKPDYFDFLYYAMVIGCAAQTADVATTSREMRMTSLAQGVFAFFYNLAILGLTVNVSAALI
jgi:uncharacterized membrane protein